MARFTEERALWIARNILPHEPALRTQIARWRLPEDLELDDVVQDVYSRFAAMESVDGISNARSYMYMIARNAIISHIRHSRVVSISAVDDIDGYGIAADAPSPEQFASDRQQLQHLANAVSELPEPNRSAFTMRFIENLSHRDIGERLGMSDNAVQKNLAKTISQLLTRIGRGGKPPAETSINDSERKNETGGRTRDQR